MFSKLLFIVTFVLSTLSLSAQDNLTVVAVGDAELEQQKITFVSKGLSNELGKQVKSILENDFSFYKNTFKVMNSSDYEGAKFDDFDFYKKKGLSYVIDLSFSGNPLVAEAKIINVSQKGASGSFKKSIFKENLRTLAHELSNDIYKSIIGKDSIFQSKIIFVSDTGSTRRNPFKELYIMDFDGKNTRKLTNHRGTVIGPAISLDGKQVLYSLIRGGNKKRNVNLYVMDLATRKSSLLSSRRGLNTGAVFSPKPGKVILTLSHQGNAEIYEMDINTKEARRLTKSYAPDVDPSINVQGTKLAFLSGRPGKPMIYTMDPSGLEKSVKRVSFIGQFNATPRFNPTGDEIAFSSWLDNRFDIFRINADGTGLYRLTKDFGSNEDPTYSNDGQFIAFSSQRVISRTQAVQNIYIMTRDGEVIGQVTKGFGNCITPRWSK
ncbi:MAG: hypothetical protein GY909_05595 [Oligoflexia bacterium]|nr:hypothetical protein [Oligoflexia bacterium]